MRVSFGASSERRDSAHKSSRSRSTTGMTTSSPTTNTCHSARATSSPATGSHAGSSLTESRCEGCQKSAITSATNATAAEIGSKPAPAANATSPRDPHQDREPAMEEGDPHQAASSRTGGAPTNASA